MTTKNPSQTELYGELLPGIVQYRQTIESFFPCLTCEQEQILIDQARAGNKEARDKMIESCLGYVRYWADHYYYTCRWQSWRIEQEELVAVGNLALVECLDQALSRDRPIGYLISVTKLKIQRHCHYHYNIIPLPKSNEVHENILVESLDIPIVDEENETYGDCLPEPSRAIQQEQRHEALEEAIQQLSERQREVILRHYGLFGRPCEDVGDIQQSMYHKKSGGAVVCNHRSAALARLYEILVTQYSRYRTEGVYIPPSSRTRKPSIIPLTEEQEKRLENAYKAVMAREGKVTAIMLQKEARIGCVYARSYAYQQIQQNYEPDRLKRLQQAYESMIARGEKVSSVPLAKAAHVTTACAATYLRQYRQQQAQKSA